MLTGKYWIIPGEGAVRVDDHNQFAQARLMKLPAGELPRLRDTGTPLSAEELEECRKRGASAIHRALLGQGGDFRGHMICQYGWIRIAKSEANCYVWDKQTKKLLALATQWWSDQASLDPDDVLDVKEFRAGGENIAARLGDLTD